MGKRLITAEEVREAAQTGQLTLSVPWDACIVTPMARDEAERLGVVLDVDDPVCPLTGAASASAGSSAGAGATSASSTTLIREVSALLKNRLPADTPMATLESVIRDVVTAKLGQATAPQTTHPALTASTAQGVRLIDHQRLIEGENGSVAVDEKIWVAEAIGGKAEDTLAGGYMSWEKASFTRQLEQPEIAVVLEGELHLDVGDTTLMGKPGDMIYFPKGAVVAYSAPARVKLACVNCI
ncbi:MAG: hypothetical protein JEZ11_12350 [Desulfobacterales bacterium]|nr:hypothetical protein [Desulfobacterales bacterium]